jgi:hypothetical protein
MQIEDSLAKRRQAGKQRNFLSHFSNLGNVRESAKFAGVSRATVYYWREHSPSFAEKLSKAADEAFGGSERKPIPTIPVTAQRGPVRKRDRMKP